MSCEERLHEEPGAALVDGGRAHLHGGRRADLGADDDPVDALERERADLLGPRARDVEPGRPRISRRRPRDRPVDDVEAVFAQLVRDPRDRRGRNRIQVGVERAPPRLAGGSLDVACDVQGGLGRDDREHDVRLADHCREVVQELERGPGHQPAAPLAPAGERRHDFRTSTGEGVPHRGAHRSGADDGDGGHGSSAGASCASRGRRPRASVRHVAPRRRCSGRRRECRHGACTSSVRE